ncbi:MAG: hypothetical protein NWF09_07725 [Candidatus Bathyarchaeota archaeon]|nr:hypothetical protein [Candidatus Bathyarchaeota archaeon]
MILTRKMYAGLWILVIIMVALLLFQSAFVDLTPVKGKVVAKYTETAGDSTAYMVLLEDGTLLEVKRNFWYNSWKYEEEQTLYQKIQINETYTFLCTGWQLDWWIIHLHKNIIKIKPTYP